MVGIGRCPAAAGWQDRIVGKTVYGAGAGSVVGAVLSILQNRPMLPHALATAVSCGVGMSLFSVLQEAVRVLRCEAGPANSMVAGAAASYLLVHAYKGRRAAVPVAVWTGGGAGVLHAAGDYFDAAAWVRRTLVRLDLLDDTELRRQMEHSHGGRRPGTKADLGWARWLPIRQLTDEEWEIYQERKREQLQQRVSAALEGGIPGLLDKERASGSQEASPGALEITEPARDSVEPEAT